MLKEFSSMSVFTTVVSRIYAPSFATLALVESIGGLICRIRHFILREYAPSSGATPIDVDLGLRNITDCCTEAGSTTIYLDSIGVSMKNHVATVFAMVGGPKMPVQVLRLKM